MDDHKDLSEHPKIDVKERGNGLLRFKETFGKAREDMAKEEDNPESCELGQKAHDHSDRAIRAAERVHADWRQEATRWQTSKIASTGAG